MHHFYFHKQVPPGRELVAEHCDNCGAIRRRYADGTVTQAKVPCDPTHIKDKAQLARIINRYLSFYSTREKTAKRVYRRKAKAIL